MKKLERTAFSVLVVVALVLACGVKTASGITIIRDFLFLGGEPPTNSTGVGSLEQIFNAACDVWEFAIKDDFTMTLHFGWSPVGGGQHEMLSQGGVPNRETEGRVLFNNDGIDGHFTWDLDPAPFNNHGKTYNEEAFDLGVGLINATRYYTWDTTNVGSDLFVIALHEIGHGLGMSYASPAFVSESVDGNIHIMAPMPFAGSVVPLQQNYYGVVSHIAYLGSGMSVMSGSFGPGIRAFPSVVDLITLGQLSQFTNLNLNLQPTLATSISKKDDGTSELNLRWFQPFGECELQGCSDSRTWAAISATETVTNGWHSITMPADNGISFFRLAPKVITSQVTSQTANHDPKESRGVAAKLRANRPVNQHKPGDLIDRD